MIDRNIQTADSPQILVVDDSPASLKLLTDILTNHGYQVRPASDGRLALRSTAVEAPDLILLDVKMPDMDGYEVCHLLKSDEQSRGIPVIFISALDETADKVKGFNAGGVDYITKPFDTSEVLARVKTHLGLRQLQKQLETQNIQLQQEISERERAEQELRKYESYLEELVYERTSELKKLNQELQMEVAERKRVEDALRKSEEKYRSIYENAVEGIFQSTLDGRFLSVNPAMAKMCFYDSPDEMVSSIEDIARKHYVVPEKREIFAKLLAEEGHVSQFEHQVYRKDGSKIWVSINVRAVRNDSGEIIYYEGTHEDITWRKQMEEDRDKIQSQLLQSQKMEAIGSLAGGIAHDFNNLLMGIQGYTSLMLLSIDKNHPNNDRLKSIEEHVQSGADLTRQLLGFARSGKYETKPIDLNEVVKKTSSMFGRTKKELTIHGKFDKNLWTVEADRGQIEQVLLNLYVNAWQAMPHGGEIFLETENVNLDETYTNVLSAEPGRYVKISVTDTGTGMDDKTKARIFDPFFTTKEMGRGAGLGLASVYGIIKGHKGIINVYSEENHGTSFNIYLPISGKEVNRKIESSQDPLRGEETILLVDDEEAILDVTKELLESLGYKVIVANGGEEAVEIYKGGKDVIDVVIMDMVMPRMNGGETFNVLKSMNPEIKVILSSGYSLNGQAITLLNLGCRAFIQKPFGLKDISIKIRELMNNK